MYDFTLSHTIENNIPITNFIFNFIDVKVMYTAVLFSVITLNDHEYYMFDKNYERFDDLPDILVFLK